MKHECKITVIDKKYFTDYQEKYLADPKSGPCPFFNVGDEFILKHTPQQDDFYHLMIGIRQRMLIPDGRTLELSQERAFRAFNNHITALIAKDGEYRGRNNHLVCYFAVYLHRSAGCTMKRNDGFGRTS